MKTHVTSRTTVLGLKRKGTVYLAADTQATGDQIKFGTRQSKLVVLMLGAEPLILGMSGEYRIGHAVRGLMLPTADDEGLVAPALGDDVQTYLYDEFVQPFRHCLHDLGGMHRENGVESMGGGGAMLVGFRDELFMLQRTFDLIDTADPFYAIGSGCEYAMGAMAAMQRLGDIDGADARPPAFSLGVAMSAAARFDPSTGSPFHIVSTVDPVIRLLA